MTPKTSETLPGVNFIDQKSRYSFTFRLCLLVVLSSTLSAIILYSLHARKLTSGYSGAFLTLLEIKEFLTISIVLTVLFQWVIVSSLALVFTLFVSHKIAGPVYRFEKSLLNMKNGDFSENLYNIRAKDQVQPLSESLNEMSSAIAFKMAEIKSRTLAISHICGKMSETMNSASSEEEKLLALSEEVTGLIRVTGEARGVMKDMFRVRNG